MTLRPYVRPVSLAETNISNIVQNLYHLTQYVNENTGPSIGTFNVKDFGAVGDGATDDAAAVKSAFSNAIASGGGVIYFPFGKYRLGSAISCTLTANPGTLTLLGDGSENSILYWPNNDGLTITYTYDNNTTHVRGLTFSAGKASAGTGLTLTADIALGSIQPTDLTDVVFRGDDRIHGGAASLFWENAFVSNGVSNINVNCCQFWGRAAGDQGTGILFTQSSNSPFFGIVYNVNFTGFFNYAVGINYGNYIQGVTVNACQFTNGQTGVFVPSGQNTTLDLLSVQNSQFGCTFNSIDIRSGVQNSFISNNYMTVQTGTIGINLSNADSVNISNNFIGAGSVGAGTGIAVSNVSAGNKTTIYGNFFNSLAVATSISSSASGVYSYGNSFNVITTIYSDSAADTIILDNATGATGPFSMGTSPSTHTAGARPETLYIRQTAGNDAVGTLAGGQVAYQAVNSGTYYSVSLSPHEKLISTWSSTTPPTFSVDAH